MKLWHDDVIESCAQAAHDEWYKEKQRRGVTSWPNENGVEQMVLYSELGEDVREFDRIVVRAIIDRMDELDVFRP